MLSLDIESVPTSELPDLLGRLTTLEARVRLRLAAPPPAPTQQRLLDADQAAALAGVSRRWLLQATRGLALRRDLSRKKPRFAEDALRAWLAGRAR